MNKSTCLVSILLVVLIVAIGFFLKNLPLTQYMRVDIHDLVGHPENYVGKHINVTGWLGDTKEFESITILIPIVICTDDTTMILWIPISDTDYYFAVYQDNAYTKGIIIKLKYKYPELLGKQVVALGEVISQEVKIEGETHWLWIIKGDVLGIS